MQQQLEQWESVLEQNNFFSDIIRNILWSLVWLLQQLCNACETLLDEVYKLLDFTNYAGIDSFFNSTELRIILGLLVAGGLIYLGITLMFDKPKNNIIHGVILFFLVVTSLPTLMTTMNGIILAGRDFLDTEEASIADQIIASSVVDFASIDRQGIENYDVANGVVTPYSGFTVNSFIGSHAGDVSYININQHLNKDIDLTNDMFYNRIIIDENGAKMTEEIKEQGWFIFATTDWYYRYNINFLAIYIGLLAGTIALFFTAFKSARIIFELVFHQIFGTLLSAVDFTGGQKVKAVLKNIFAMYVTLLLTILLLQLFILGMEFVTVTVSNPLASSLILISFAFSVIDGPNIIERILGVDAGLSSGMQKFASLMMGSNALASLGGKAKNAVGGVFGLAGRGVEGTSGLVGSAVGATEARGENLNNNAVNNSSGSSPISATNTSNNSPPLTSTNSSNVNSTSATSSANSNQNVSSPSSANVNSNSSNINSANTSNTDTNSSNANLQNSDTVSSTVGGVSSTQSSVNSSNIGSSTNTSTATGDSASASDNLSSPSSASDVSGIDNKADLGQTQSTTPISSANDNLGSVSNAQSSVDMAGRNNPHLNSANTNNLQNSNLTSSSPNYEKPPQKPPRTIFGRTAQAYRDGKARGYHKQKDKATKKKNRKGD